MISLKKNKEQGFTIVELLIVIVVIGILAAIVITTYSGIQAKARNAKRETDIQSLQTQIEAFYSQNQYYPSLTDMNSSAWRATNMKSLDASAMQDPSWSSSNTACTVSGAPTLLTTSQSGCYGYAPTASGASCEAADTTCNQYTLTASMEQGVGTYTKANLD